MAEENDMIIAWYGSDIKPENEQQRLFMLDTAQLFELHTMDEKISTDDVAKEIRSKYPASLLFSKTFLSNKAFFSKLRHNIVGMGLDPKSEDELRPNSHIPLKLAYSLYPGDEFRDERESTEDLINKYFNEEGISIKSNKKDENQQTETTQSLAEEKPKIASNPKKVH